MKTQTHLKTKALHDNAFVGKTLLKEAKQQVNGIAFDKELCFDTDWGYSYLMDYISLLKKKKPVVLLK